MTDARLYVHVLLDRSGSMEDCRDKTIDAFNEFVNGLKVGSKAPTRLSLTTFDSQSIDLVHDQLRVANVPRMTRDTFVPRASTPLFDAIGHTVTAIDKVTLLPDERVMLSILTDGMENASTEYKSDTVRKLLTDRQERSHWLVQYLGANHDAWSVGRSMGIQPAMAMDFDVGHVGAAMHAMSRSAARYRSAPKAAAVGAASFTPAERQASKGKTS